MDANIISLESMLAARESADWTFWIMLSSFLTIAISFITMIIAVKALNGWRQQERSKELKEFTVSIYRYQASVNMAPDIVIRGMLDEMQNRAVLKVFESLDKVYESTLLMHNVKLRGRASDIYMLLQDVHDRYISGVLEKNNAIEEILLLRVNEELLNLSH